MEQKKSLVKVLTKVQIMVFSFMCLFLILDSILFCMRTVESFTTEKNFQVQAETKEVDARMKAVQMQLREIFYTIVNNNSLWSANEEKKYFGKIEVNQLIAEKQFLYPDMGTTFVIRSEDYLLFHTKENIWKSLEFREYIKNNVKDIVTTYSDSNWKVCRVEDSDYLMLVYCYDEFEIYVGVAIEPEELLSGISEIFQESEGGFSIEDKEGGKYKFQAGKEKFWGDGKLSEIPLQGGLMLSGFINISYLELFLNNMIIIILVIGVICIASIVSLNLLLKKMIIKPVTNLSAAVKSAEENIEEIVVEEDAQTEEFFVLQKTLNYLLREVISTRLQLYERKLQKQDMELRQLRAQLRPHFYLNAIMTVSSMTYQNRNEEIREYLNSLSNHMRYMMRISTRVVDLGEELQHIENYFKMQEIKFPSSAVLFVDCPEELARKKIPHLILYTIIENAFKYAMDLSDTLILMIECRSSSEEGFSGYYVVVEDNGKGFDEETLLLYNSKNVISDEEGYHIGLSNVKRSLILEYDREDLLHLSNAIPKGAKIEIKIPDMKEDRE